MVSRLEQLPELKILHTALNTANLGGVPVDYCSLTTCGGSVSAHPQELECVVDSSKKINPGRLTPEGRPQHSSQGHT